MFCTQCGANNADTAVTCVQCGRPLQGAQPSAPVGVVQPPGYQQAGYQQPVSVQNYLVPAILVTIFCCLPAGIVAIVYAAQVNGKLAGGDVAGAMDSSKNAKTWCLVSAGAGVVVIVVWCLLMFLGALSNFNR